MAKNLLIVESPGKLKTLRKILGREWLLEASVGHTTELASDGPKRLGFELREGRVIARYVPRGSRGRQVLAKLRKAAKESEKVYLATDPDREGEAIAWHLVEQLGLREGRYCRVAYTQITEAAVRKAIQNPLRLDLALIDAQRARQCLDKLVGFEVSPLLWNSTGGKSAGRVQSATLHLICERERERIAFRPENYWVLRSRYREGFEAVHEPAQPAGPGTATASPSGAAGSSAAGSHPDDAPESARIRSEAEARLIAEVARTSPHVVAEEEQKEERRNPPPPFITSSLQQAAGARYRYSPKKTMQIAQELYEGVGGKGLITYMRTDAVALSPEFVSEARAWLEASSPESLPERPPFYRAKADAQGAHEAIRPTQASLTPEEASRILNPDQLNVYRLVWERAIASQCKPARLSRSKIVVDCAGTRWVARGQTVLEPGYLAFWKNLGDERELPRVRVGQRLGFEDVSIDEKTTQPPPRYSEPKLVQLMERKGIGRPSTYASTLATLKDRDYVVLDRGSLAPTPLGLATDEALARAIPELVDTAFTARMESSLDEIAAGKLPWEAYLTRWNDEYLAPALVKARAALAGTARVAATGAKAGAGFGARTGAVRGVARERARGGKARGKAKRQRTGAKGRRGSGKGKTAGPGTPAIAEAREKARQLGVAPVCAQGHGELELRQSRKGALYWRCARPDCENFAWYARYSDRSCPECGAPLEEIPSAKVTGGSFLKCARKGKHESEIVMFRNRSTGDWELKRPRG